MDIQSLKAELNRPAYLWLAVTLVLLVSANAAVVLAYVLPARDGLQAVQQEKAMLIERHQLATQLNELGNEVNYWASVVPQTAEKLNWKGSASDFSGAVLDASILANVRLDKEINEVRSGETHRVYSKTLYFKAGYPAIERFLHELGQRELLVVPGSLSLAPVEEGADTLGVTLSLSGYSEIQP